MDTRWYSQRLGMLSTQQLQTALDRFQLGRLIHAEPVPLGNFGQNVFLTSCTGYLEYPFQNRASIVAVAIPVLRYL